MIMLQRAASSTCRRISADVACALCVTAAAAACMAIIGGERNGVKNDVVT